MFISKIYRKTFDPGDEGDGGRFNEELVDKRLFPSEEDAKDYFRKMQEDHIETERVREIRQSVKPAEWPKNVGKDGYNVQDQMDWA